jgi:hypothetical protein
MYVDRIVREQAQHHTDKPHFLSDCLTYFSMVLPEREKQQQS